MFILAHPVIKSVRPNTVSLKKPVDPLQWVQQKQKKTGPVIFLSFLNKNKPKTHKFSIFSLFLCEEQMRDRNTIFITTLCNISFLLWFWFSIEYHKTFLLARSGSETLGLGDALPRDWRSWHISIDPLQRGQATCSSEKAPPEVLLGCRIYLWPPLTFLQP